MEIDMSKTKTITITLAVLLIAQGCISTVITTDPTPTAPPAASTPLPADGSSTPEPTEIESGAVFEVPPDLLSKSWLQAQLAPTETPMLQKGRSNYQ